MFEILVAPAPDPKVQRQTSWIAKTTSSTPEASWHTSSRLSDYSLVKEHLTNTLTSTFVFAFVCFPGRFPDWGGGMLQSFPPLSTGCRENFFRPSRGPNQPLSNRLTGPLSSVNIASRHQPTKSPASRSTRLPAVVRVSHLNSKECCLQQL